MTEARTQSQILALAVERFRIDTGRLPTPAEGLTVLLTRPPGLAEWKGPYVKQLRADPCGRPYLYRVGAARSGESEFRVLSVGPDGREGSADDLVAEE